MKSRLFGPVCVCIVAFLSAPTNAALYSLEWSLSEGEPYIQGIIDTQQDLLRITHWSDQDQTATSEFFARTPDLTDTSVFPDNEWQMYAYQANGDIYDIPDNWNGDIGIDWGFISSIDLDSIPWNEGSGHTAGPPGVMEVVYTGFGAWKHGAYGLTGPGDGGNFVGGDATANSPTRMKLNGVVLDEEGNVYQAGGLYSVQVVPIPAAVWLFSSGMLGLIGVARCTKTA